MLSDHWCDVESHKEDRFLAGITFVFRKGIQHFFLSDTKGFSGKSSLYGIVLVLIQLLSLVHLLTCSRYL